MTVSLEIKLALKHHKESQALQSQNLKNRAVKDANMIKLHN